MVITIDEIRDLLFYMEVSESDEAVLVEGQDGRYFGCELHYTEEESE